MDERLDQAPFGVIETTLDGTIHACNDAAETVLETDITVDARPTIGNVFPQSAAATLHDAYEDAPPTSQSFEEYYPTLDRWLNIDLRRMDDRVVIYLQDRSKQHAQSQTINRLKQRLARLETIDAVVATVLRELTAVSDRSEIARTICDELGTTDLYAFTWVGEQKPGSDQLQMLAAAGDSREFREAIERHLTGTETLPEQQAVTTEQTQRIQPLADTEAIPRDVRLTAFGKGFQSCIAVPIAHRGTVYGVIGVYSAREDGFSDQEQSSLETLGAIAGYAINASQQEELLYADTITELAIEITDSTIPFISALQPEEGQISLTGVVPQDDGSIIYYLTPEELSEAATERLAAHSTVKNVRFVREEEPPLLQVSVRGHTPAAVLAARGGTISTGRYVNDTARLVVELPPDTDVRRVIEALGSAFEETTIVSKTEQPRSPQTVQTFQDEIASSLTEKQQTVLRTAYLADYFRSPRGSTAEEVADALGITAPTVLYHLREAQRKLLDVYFAEPTEEA